MGVTGEEFLGSAGGESREVGIPRWMGELLPPSWKGLNDKLFQSLYVIARRKPEVSVEQAQANVNVLFKQAVRELTGPQPTKKQLDDIQHALIELTPAATGLSKLRAQFSKPLRVLMAAVGLVLLVAGRKLSVDNCRIMPQRPAPLTLRAAISVGSGRSRHPDSALLHSTPTSLS